MTIGEKIKQRRKQVGLTQEQLAKYAGVHPVSIGKYEAGKIQPQIVQLKKISRSLGCSIFYFIEEERCPVDPREIIFFEGSSDVMVITALHEVFLPKWRTSKAYAVPYLTLKDIEDQFWEQESFKVMAEDPFGGAIYRYVGHAAQKWHTIGNIYC